MKVEVARVDGQVARGIGVQAAIRIALAPEEDKIVKLGAVCQLGRHFRKLCFAITSWDCVSYANTREFTAVLRCLMKMSPNTATTVQVHGNQSPAKL